MSGWQHTDEAEDARDGYVPRPPNPADVLGEQVPGSPDPGPGPATGQQPFDDR